MRVFPGAGKNIKVKERVTDLHRAAFFDIDGTLVSCQTQQVLGRICLKRGILSRAQFIKLLCWFAAYKWGLFKDTVDIRTRMYQMLKQKTKREIDALFNDCAQEVLLNHARTSMANIVKGHLNSGDLVFAVSATLKPIGEIICRYYEISSVYATELNVGRNGDYDGTWRGCILEGEAKKRIVQDLTIQYDVDLKSSFAYGDSAADIQMLESVGHPCVVNPDGKLRKYAKAKGWQISSYV